MFSIQVAAFLTSVSNNLLNIIRAYFSRRFRIVCPRRWSDLYLVTYTSEQTQKARLLSFLTFLLIRNLGTMEGQFLLKVPLDHENRLKQQTQYSSPCCFTSLTRLHRHVIFVQFHCVHQGAHFYYYYFYLRHIVQTVNVRNKSILKQYVLSSEFHFLLYLGR